jgi:hypothetical protein
MPPGHRPFPRLLFFSLLQDLQSVVFDTENWSFTFSPPFNDCDLLVRDLPWSGAPAYMRRAVLARLYAPPVS